MRILQVTTPSLMRKELRKELHDRFDSEEELNDYINEFFTDDVFPCLQVEEIEIKPLDTEDKRLLRYFELYGF